MIVECNDEVGATPDLVTFPTIAGNSYLIVLGGWQAGVLGVGTIDMMQTGSPAVGSNFCSSALNSSGSEAIISATGSDSIAANNLVLVSAPGPVGEPGVFYYGPTALTGIPFGDGVRCVAGGAGAVVSIFPFVVADGLGTMSTSIDNTNPVHAQIVPGMTLHFQCWFRDPAASMTGFNLSDGYTILFGI